MSTFVATRNVLLLFLLGGSSCINWRTQFNSAGEVDRDIHRGWYLVGIERLVDSKHRLSMSFGQDTKARIEVSASLNRWASPLDCEQLQLTTPKATLEFDKVTFTSGRIYGSPEKISTSGTAPVADFINILDQPVSLNWCGAKFSLTPEQMEKLREFGRKLQ